MATPTYACQSLLLSKKKCRLLWQIWGTSELLRQKSKILTDKIDWLVLTEFGNSKHFSGFNFDAKRYP